MLVLRYTLKDVIFVSRRWLGAMSSQRAPSLKCDCCGAEDGRGSELASAEVWLVGHLRTARRCTQRRGHQLRRLERCRRVYLPSTEDLKELSRSDPLVACTTEEGERRRAKRVRVWSRTSSTGCSSAASDHEASAKV